ncbi:MULTISPECIES: alpha-2-macroglobulin [unclassified Marinobacterium]|uniref:alpha-2-macroglobulin family protein n=1 Tax=unclassified Marinobacterium TaxID=2644139 RepID=UPI001569D8AA|nr:MULTISPECIES: MG2 domain-containing protein [unclassified Marinobacterium]NRP10101.1 MG2 domain protein [Marinobacterium sp. xm-g-48]NRP82946.1 MG2 domain protein [Marinobacterium sp. xm-d-509]
MSWLSIRSALLSLVTTGIIATSINVSAMDQYVVIKPVKALGDQLLTVGSIVEVLGINDVPSSVAQSGKLITFLKGGEVFTADAANFEKTIQDSNLSLTPFEFVPSKGGNAQVCSTLYRTTDKARLNPESEDLAKYIQVFSDGNRVNANFIAPKTELYYQDMSYERFSRSSTDLCIQGLEYDSTYSVKFLSGLSVVSCTAEECKPFQLDKEITSWAQTGSKPASINISSGQTILPAKQTALVPITVTNLKEIDVQIFKVDLRSINSGYYNFKSLDGYDVKGFENNVGLKVGSYTVPVSVEPNVGKKINLDLSKMIPVDEPGLYVAIFESEALGLSNYQTRPTQWLIRSNIAVSTYHGIESTKVLLSEFDTTSAISDAEVTVLAGNNRVLFEGKSDRNGLASIPSKLIAGNGDHAPKYLIAKRNHNEIALVEFKAKGNTLSVGQNGEEKKDSRDVYLTTDRKLYRAGEKVEFLSIARDTSLNALSDKDFKVELRDPEGLVVHTEVINSGDVGFNSGTIPLSDSARLGKYELRVLGMDEVVLASHEIKLQDFVPLTIETKLSIPSPWIATTDNYFELKSSYFSGGAAAGLKAEVQTSLIRKSSHSNPELSGYYFGLNEAASNDALNSYDDNVLGDDGTYTAKLTIDAEKYAKSGIYSVRIKGSTFDIGGRPNTAVLDVPLDTNSSYLGAKTLFDGALSDGASPSFKVVNVDIDGTKQPLQTYNYKLQRVEYDFNWYYDNGWRYRRTRLGSEIIAEGTSDSETLALDTTFGWGAYELSIESADGFNTVVPFWAGWYGDKPVTEPTDLALSAERVNKSQLKVRVKAPFAGQLRLMEATGDIESISFHEVSKGENEILVPSKVNAEPGFHVLGTLIRPITRGQEHLPQIAMGTKWISQLSDNRIIDTQIVVDAKQRSTESTDVTIKLDVDSGKARIFLVDDGIHAITRYSNEDPSKFFYGPRKLSLGFLSNFGSLVQQDDSLAAYGVGGDQAAGGSAVAKSDFFKTVIASSPVLNISNGSVSYSFDAPDFEGRLRAVVIVAGESGVGFEQADIAVQDQISIDTSLPRFVGAGDKISGKLGLRFNDPIDQVTLTQKVGEQETETTLPGSVGGKPLSQSISLNALPSGNIPVDLSLKYGNTKIDRDYNLVVREPSYPLTKMFSVKLENGVFSNSQSISALDLSDFSNTDNAEVLWSLSPLPGASMNSVVQSLNRYPYGCIEQTSSVTRGLFVSADNTKESADVLEKIAAGVERIIAKQKTNGAFGYWDRNDRVELEYLPYAVDTLISSRKYLKDTSKVDESIKNALHYIDRQFFEDAWTGMYAYGVLAQSGYEVTSRARYAIDEQLPKALSGNKWLGRQLDLVAAGYWLAIQIKDQKRADALSIQLQALLEESETLSLPDWFNGSDDWFQPSSLRETLDKLRYWYPRSGVMVGALSASERSDAINQYVAKSINKLATADYRSTLDNANFASLLSGEQAKLDALSIKIDGMSIPVLADNSVAIGKDKVTQGFELDHSVDGDVYLNAEVVGRRAHDNSIDNGFKLGKVWVDANGRAFNDNQRPLNVKQGDLFTVIVAIEPTDDHGYGNLMMTDLLPTGFEIETQAGFDPFFIDKDGEKIVLDRVYRAKPNWSESMDDRFIANFSRSWDKGDMVAAYYQVRAVYTGEMVIPDAHAELMYRPEINGRSASTTGSISVGE